MLRLSLAVGLVLIFNGLLGQVFWTEDFGTGDALCTESDLVNDFTSPNGMWSVTETGINAPQGNVWYVSAREAGMGEGNCGDGCTEMDPGLTNKTLHVSTDPSGDLGAAYFETGFGFTDADIRAESPTIDCSNRTDISMDFLYMTAGAPPNDICIAQYFDGATWSDLGILAPTPVGCPGGQGEWTANSFALPASADLNPNVRIGFRWINVDDGVATDPSVAIDDIELSGTPEGVVEIFADFSASETTICVGDCVDFTDESTGAGIDTWDWLFESAETAVSSDQNPTDICYQVAGTYSVSLTISSPDDTDELTQNAFITVEECGSPPVAAFSASETEICAGDCIDFTDESTGDGIDGWAWTLTGSDTPVSADQNPADVCYQTPGTYAVTLTASNAEGDDQESIADYITVTDCSEPPVAAFSASVQNICVGDCVDFTDESTGPGITDWEWTFDGAETTASTDQNPTGICYETAGSYSVTLAVTNADGSDDVTELDFIVVDACLDPPVADFTSNIQEICEGDCIDFSDLSVGTNITDWEWTFEGADTPTSSDQNPADICYAAAGVYDVTLSVTNSEGTDEITIDDFIVVTVCEGPTASFAASDTTLCLGACIDFFDQSIGGATSYEWTFEGADTPTSNDQNPVDICYNTEGQFSVTLSVSDGVDTDDSTMVAYIDVEECPIVFPELSIEASTNLICVGDCISFTDESANDTISDWVWTFEGAEDPAVSLEQNPQEVCYFNEGTYDVTLETLFLGLPLDSTFSNFITVVDTCGPVANFNYTPIVCLGQCYDFENTSTGGDSYFWTFEGAATPTSEEENPFDICYLDETGVFNVTLTVVNEFGSSTSITQQITVVPPSPVSAGPDQIITQGTNATLSGGGGNGTGEYVWQPFEDVNCFDCPTTQTVPLQSTTTFVLYYEESGGCESSDTVTVFVNEVTTFGVPNSFSPNNDGVNDILYVRGNNITRVTLIVYNRYGQQVFETNSQSEGWDGTMNGKELNAGVFGYYLEASFLDGTSSSEKGDITLVR